MSIHPNVILMAVLTPDDLPCKTMRDILAETGIQDDGLHGIRIGSTDYHFMVMKSDFDETGYQIAAKEGELVFHSFMTYGYGEVVGWEQAERQKNELEAWAKGVCERHHCKYRDNGELLVIPRPGRLEKEEDAPESDRVQSATGGTGRTETSGENSANAVPQKAHGRWTARCH